jgi:hypothetical protein
VRTIAYLDANSGSLIAGAIAAGGAAFAVFFKTRLHQVTRIFKRKGPEQETTASAATPPEEA